MTATTSYDGTVAGRAPALLRLAHQLLGDPDVASDVVSSVLSRRRIRRSVAVAHDEVVVAALVRAARRRRQVAVATPSPLDALSTRERIAVVLAFAADWDAPGIGEATGTSPRRVRAEVVRALSVLPEAAWRQLLAEPRWDVGAATGVDRRAVAVARQRRRRQLREALAAGSAVTLVAGVTVAVVRVATAPPAPPPAAHVAGLLDWTPRGALVTDARFVSAAAGLWRRSTRPPAGRVYVLYAGRVGIGRLAVLQALGRDGRARVAVVADHDVSYLHPRLQLDTVSALPRTDVPLLTVPYDGNLSLPGLTSGPGSRVLQALAAPGIDRVEERDSRAPPDEEPRPGFVAQAIPAEGLSEPWLDLTGPLASTAVRAYRGGRLVFNGLVVQHALQPVAFAGRVVAPPEQWAGLTRERGLPALLDDVLWWAQVCHSPRVDVALVWADGVRAVTTPVRLEFVSCPGRRPNMPHWVVGLGAGAQTIRHRPSAAAPGADAYVTTVPPDSLAPPTVVVVGTSEVATIRVGRETVRGRVASVTLDRSGVIVVRDADGRRLVVG